MSEYSDTYFSAFRTVHGFPGHFGSLAISHATFGHLGYSLDLIFTQAADKIAMPLPCMFFCVSFLILSVFIDIYSASIFIDLVGLAS